MTSATWDQVVLAAKKPVLVDFWASWCGPCRQLAPIVEQAARDKSASLVVARLDVDAETDLAERYGVGNLPCLMVFRDGRLVAQHAGLVDRAQLDAFLGEAGVAP